MAPEWSAAEPPAPDPRPRSFGAPLDYAATAIRPAYTSLPESVRRAIAAELGGDPFEVAMAGGGFTTGFAARLRAASGTARFVKAAGPDTPEVRESVRAEARFNAALPTGVPSPALRFHTEVDGWAVTGFEAVPAKPVTLPMTPGTLDLMLRSWAEAAEALSPPTPELIAAGVTVKHTRNLKWFRAVAGGELTAFGLPPSLRGRWNELADLETGIERVLDSRQVSHADLRPDNMLVSEDRAWVCDWAKPRYMPHWLDTAILLSIAHGDGHDAEQLFWTHPTAQGVAGEELDAALAAVTGALLQGWPNAPSRIVAPAIQTHMRWAGLATADWLAQRRGWREPKSYNPGNNSHILERHRYRLLMAKETATYIHGHHESVLRSHTWRTAENSAAYLLSHLQPDHKVLDIGCGPGTISADLAVLASDGHVTAVDHTPTIMDQAAKEATSRGLTNMDFAVADVHGLAYEDDTFDVVHAHQVLQHVGDPVQALREMRRVAKPGGVVAVRDSDYAAFTWFPESKGLSDWLDLYERVARVSGGEPDAGRRLKSWALKAGFEEQAIEATSSTWTFANEEDRRWWGGLWADRSLHSDFAKQAVAGGHATQAELQAISEAWKVWGQNEASWLMIPHGEILCRL